MYSFVCLLAASFYYLVIMLVYLSERYVLLLFLPYFFTLLLGFTPNSQPFNIYKHTLHLLCI